MVEVQDILLKYGADFKAKHHLSYEQLKAMNAIQKCRTAELGGHLDICSSCGYSKPSYNSCRNRFCPKCQSLAKEKWINNQKCDLLNVQYFHVVFTVPAELNPVFYENQSICYNLLFRSVSETLQELAHDKKYLGASLGFTAVLHTWGQNLHYHPHIHCIVPAGGLDKSGVWKNSRKKFFLPVKVLSAKFRGKFLALLKEALPSVSANIIDTCYSQKWVVYCKPPFKNAGYVVEYLGRYTHRVAISNNRILSMDNGKVTFKWRDYSDGNKQKVMTLSADEFMRRFFMHVLPKGFSKIRHFGFLSSRGKHLNLKRCKLQTHTFVKFKRLSTDDLLEKILGRKPSVCPDCGCPLIHNCLHPPLLHI